MPFTNSPLVSYTKLSPNCYKPRNHAIDTITIHCYCGQVSVERICSGFARPEREASCNYGVAYDGRICLVVEEKNGCWCTNSKSNDMRSVVIEVASDHEHPYKINDVAMASLIKLIADICKRNNIKKLLWKGDKKLIGKVTLQNMTVHRWFANKACPGQYLYDRHPYIAAEVNKLLGVTAPPPPPPKPDGYVYTFQTSDKTVWALESRLKVPHFSIKLIAAGGKYVTPPYSKMKAGMKLWVPTKK
jgi:hypothetical protein